MVRLITHNLLACHAKACISSPDNFPLVFQDVQLSVQEAEFNPAFVRGFLPRVHWPALVGAARQLGDTSLPETLPEGNPDDLDEEFLQRVHHVLLEIHVDEGAMVCQNCKHVYSISSGIPNMLLAEHEIG